MRFLPRRKPATTCEAAIALEQAAITLDAIKDRSHEVTQISAALRILRERNHFAEQMGVIMGGSNDC